MKSDAHLLQAAYVRMRAYMRGCVCEYVCECESPSMRIFAYVRAFACVRPCVRVRLYACVAAAGVSRCRQTVVYTSPCTSRRHLRHSGRCRRSGDSPIAAEIVAQTLSFCDTRGLRVTSLAAGEWSRHGASLVTLSSLHAIRPTRTPPSQHP